MFDSLSYLTKTIGELTRVPLGGDEFRSNSSKTEEGINTKLFSNFFSFFSTPFGQRNCKLAENLWRKWRLYEVLISNYKRGRTSLAFEVFRLHPNGLDKWSKKCFEISDITSDRFFSSSDVIHAID